MLGVIRKTFQFLDDRMFKLFFKGMIQIHMEYAATVWSPANKSNIENIESVQRRGTKALPGMQDLTCEQRLIFLNLPTLRFRKYRGDMIEVCKIMKEIYDKQCLPPQAENVVKDHFLLQNGSNLEQFITGRNGCREHHPIKEQN